MKAALVLTTLVFVLSLFTFLGSVVALDEQYSCETCPMIVDSEALDHFNVTDENGNRHYVECIGCALKLLQDHDIINIVTYCDWYGPDYVITINITNHGSETIVNPSTAVTLVGGGCTGNRIAYNQTAADNLLANGYSNYTMKLMQQALPTNTNITTVSSRALKFAANQEADLSGQNWFVIGLLVSIGLIVVVASVVAYRKFGKR